MFILVINITGGKGSVYYRKVPATYTNNLHVCTVHQ